MPLGTKRVLALLCALLLLALGVYWRANRRDPRRIAARTLQSVVVLEPADDVGRATGVGTGFFVAPDVIATNLHVIEGSWAIAARTVVPQMTVPIEGLLGMDRASDIALLKSKQRGTPLVLVPGEPEMGSTAYVVGNPRGLEGSFSAGVVSAVRREGTELFIQITAPISPGSSGSPVLGEDGDVVGIAAASVRDGQNLNLAVPASKLKLLLQSSNRRRPAPIYEATVGSGRARDQARLRGPVKSVTLPWLDRRLGPGSLPGDLDDHHCLAEMECTLEFNLLGNLVQVRAGTHVTRFEYESNALVSYTSTANDESCTVNHPAPGIEEHACGIERWRRTFDRYHRLVETRVDYTAGPKHYGFVDEFTYDASGCMTRETGVTTSATGQFQSTTTFQCDSQNDPVSFTEVIGEPWTMACTYDRDRMGNWTTRTCREPEGQEPKGEGSVARRLIEYFGQP